MNVRLVVAIALLLLIGVFVVMNLEEARVWLFGVRAQIPIAIVVIACSALGFGAGVLFMLVKPAKKPGEKAGPQA